MVEQFQNGAIGVVNEAVFQRRKVDLGGAFGGVSESGTDDGDRDVVVVCHACPRVARGVGGQSLLQSHES